MAEGRSAGAGLRRGAVVVAVLVAAAGAIWWIQDWRQEGHRTPAARDAPAVRGATDEAGSDAGEAPGAAASAGAPAPSRRIPENGRLAVSRADLRDGAALAIGLGLPDAERGRGLLPAKIVDVRGRVLELAAVAIEGRGSGVRVEIDSDWLTPGRYMIQLESAGGGLLPVRRYVLEVLPEAPAKPGSAGAPSSSE